MGVFGTLPHGGDRSRIESTALYEQIGDAGAGG